MFAFLTRREIWASVVCVGHSLYKLMCLPHVSTWEEFAKPHMFADGTQLRKVSRKNKFHNEVVLPRSAAIEQNVHPTREGSWPSIRLRSPALHWCFVANLLIVPNTHDVVPLKHNFPLTTSLVRRQRIALECPLGAPAARKSVWTFVCRFRVPSADAARPSIRSPVGSK